MSKISILAFTLFFVLFGREEVQAQTLKIGDPAPQFSVEGWLKNKPEDVLEKGKVHVVEFWATWCQPCLAGVPHLNKIAAQYKNQGLVVYGISILERKNVGLDSLQRFMNGAIGRSMQYSIAADGPSNFMKVNWVDAIGQRGIPFAIVIDRTGHIAWQGHPNGLDNVLPDILDGQWDLQEKRKQFADEARLKTKDGNEVVN
ncbi:MAG: TlpA family protein disulfide reductase, partial [Sphingobacterium sp.]|nr:TlpA family protein disulfide reductase [Sphingobacterium sp.]